MYAMKLCVAAAVTLPFLLNPIPAQADLLFFDFTSVLHDGIGSGGLTNKDRLLSGTFYADLTYPYKIYGFHDAQFGGRPIEVLTSRGVHDFWSNPSRPIASMYMQFISQTENGIASQVVLAFQKYDRDGTPIVIAYDAYLDGGPSPAIFTPRHLPEIDGSALPRAMFIIFGIFLILYRPNSNSEFSSLKKLSGSRR